MSRLVVLTRFTLVPGFRLAGVEAHGVGDSESACRLIEDWLDDEEGILLAIDHDILQSIDQNFLKRLDDNQNLLFIPIPGGHSIQEESFRRQHIVRMIQQAVGVRITFKGQVDE